MHLEPTKPKFVLITIIYVRTCKWTNVENAVS